MDHRCWISRSIVALHVTVGAICSPYAVSHGAAITPLAGDQTIMATFIQDNQFDIAMSTIAIQKATRKDVKDLAR